jgi:site-specific DNA-methyltransferase (adenine-specific)
MTEQQLGDCRLLRGDCLDLMAGIPDRSVDMVLADPPYGTTACKWDSVIPLDQMWAHLKRIIKPNGAIVMTASQPFTTTLIASNMKQFKYCWVWEKARPSGFVQAKNKPMASHEDVVVFSEGVTVHEGQSRRRMPYNPQGTVVCDRSVKNSKSQLEKGSDSSFSKRPGHKKTYQQTQTNYPRSVLKVSSESLPKHPTQKPVALMEYLIRTYTHEGETVLDFTMGSGTTGVACVNTGRKFIGMELDPDYFNIAVGRIAEELLK